MPPPLLDRRLLFVTGKGGVGKTSVTAALASLAARQGKRVLAIEVDERGDLADFFEASSPGFTAREVQPGLHLMTLTTEESLREYLKLNLRIPLITRIGPLARTFDFVATAAPGVREILTVGKVAWEVREGHYDLVVVDASASGHVVAQLAAPDTIGELVRVGLVRDQTGWMQDLLGDPATTGVVVVTTPEEMPVSETVELVERLRVDTRVDLAAVVANRVLPELSGRREEALFDEWRSPERVAALAAAVSQVTPTTDEAVRVTLDAAELAVRLRRARADHLTRLRAEISADVPLLFVPELFTRAHGARATAQVADSLAAELS
ncbi:MAG TPA: ArsA family ATPase [Acidimicrobiales bacterium]|nr:ArsA family ATPase [Acidimicrobiales bacterium]